MKSPSRQEFFPWLLYASFLNTLMLSLIVLAFSLLWQTSTFCSFFLLVLFLKLFKSQQFLAYLIINSFTNKFCTSFYITLNGILNRHYCPKFCLFYSNVVKNTMVASFHFIGFTVSFLTEESSMVTLIQANWFKKVKPFLSMTLKEEVFFPCLTRNYLKGKLYKNTSSLSGVSEIKSLIQYGSQKAKSSRLPENYLMCFML